MALASGGVINIQVAAENISTAIFRKYGGRSPRCLAVGRFPLIFVSK
jgi:hypothetical protein